MAKARRTTHRSSSGKKLYAVRDKSGKFKDIQTYERSHRADLAKSTEGEKEAKKAGKKKATRKAKRKAGTKKVARKTGRKKATRKKAGRKKAAKKS